MATRKETPFKLESVTVRMYRPGLGDCFLLTFRGKQGARKLVRYLLIDCGVLGGTSGESERLGKVVADIQKETGGALHTLVVTHEHADHLSGFGYHKEAFKDTSNFKIDQVWLGWTEDKDDPEVQKIYSTVRQVPTRVLEQALEELRKTGKHSYEKVKKVAQFLKDNGMEDAKEIAKAQGSEPLYLRPDAGQDGPTRVIQWDDFGGVRFHVLGPPEDPELLRRSDPPKSKASLDRGEALNPATSFAMAVMHLAASQGRLQDAPGLSASDVEEMFELSLPFDSHLGIPLKDLQKNTQAASGGASDDLQAVAWEFYRARYGLKNEPTPQARGDGLGTEWRRIDSDWLESAGSLALYLDGDINNTSLVLAIELGESGKVLLFPGDAQYGNWLSWARTKHGSDLLARTVFYKVGHHGSHNATLKKGGLSLMGTAKGFDELVAMIPVDTAKAKTKGKDGWKMPEDELRELLLHQTHGRLIIACEGDNSGEQCPDFVYHKPAAPPPGARISERDWQSFLSAIEFDRGDDHLWVEYTLKP
jgi:hypothetical protein